MSSMVHYVGKLTPTGKEVSEYVADNAGLQSDGLSELFEYKYCETAYSSFVDGLVFEVEKTEKVAKDCTGIFSASKNEDGTIDFEIRYYDGGYTFDDALDLAIEEIGLNAT